MERRNELNERVRRSFGILLSNITKYTYYDGLKLVEPVRKTDSVNRRARKGVKRCSHRQESCQDLTMPKNAWTNGHPFENG